MSISHAIPFRLTFLVMLLSLSSQVSSALPEPIADGWTKDWTKGKDLPNSAFALGVSHGNFLEYYKESGQRYNTLPPSTQLGDAILGWDTYISSNIPTLSIFIRDNSPPNNDGGWTVVTPEIPLVNRVVTPVKHKQLTQEDIANNRTFDNIGFRKPLLPPMRLSRDGRIGLVPGSGGVDGKPQPLRIRLNRPEVLSKHFLESAAGVPTLDPKTWEVSDHSKWGLPSSKTTHFVSICEGVSKIPSEKNPYACGASGKDDCYNLTLVGSAVTDSFSTSAIYGLNGGYRTLYMPQLESGDRVYSRKMTVRVSNPKTKNAEIAAVDISADYKVAPIRQGVLYELNTVPQVLLKSTFYRFNAYFLLH